jgi:hypothetical protein
MHFPGREGEEFSAKDGVSCDGCHGPSERWIGLHFTERERWRRRTPQEKWALGMRDLRDPATRGTLCMSCHVGNVDEGKVVTHAMYAAGHPPLPGIELATFSKNLPQHWMDLKDVPYLKGAPAEVQKLYHYDAADVQNTRVAMIGSGVALREQTNLVANRANLASGDANKRWPELALPYFADLQDRAQLWPQVAMAHSDCYACHHDLKRASWRQERGYGLRLLDGQLVEGTPGRPQISPWPIDLFEATIRQTARDRTDSQNIIGGLKSRLDKPYSSLNVRPFGDLKEVRQASEQLRDWCASVVAERLTTARLDGAAQVRLLHTLCAQPDGYYPDFDTARQIASAFQVVYLEANSRTGSQHSNDKKIRAILQNLDRALALWAISGAHPSQDARKKLVWEQLEKLAGKKLATEKDFQETLRDLDKEKLMAALLDKDFLAAVQRIRDKDFVESSQAAANYDPVLLKHSLMELSKLLPPE